MEPRNNTSTKKCNPPLSKEDAEYVQAVSGTLLYYGRAVDPTILPALSSIATEQAKPTEKTKETVKQLLDYCATQEEAIIPYTASKMILCDAGGSHHNVHSQQNDRMHTQQRRIRQREERQKPSGRSFFPIKQ